MLKIPLDLSRARRQPLYHQLYEGLAGQIRTGDIPAGTRLPGKRTLAAELSLSVNTVDTAYQMLAAEGYVEARPRSGFAVLPFTDILPARGARESAAPRAAEKPEQPVPARAAENRPGATPAGEAAPAARFDLRTAGTDTALFPFRTWGRLQKELLYSAPELLAHGSGQGDAELRAALAAYLAAYRGVQCAPEQIVVGAGAEYLVGLAAPLLGGVCAVEDPGYAVTRTILENSGIRCRPVPVDGGGLSVEALARSGANLCYVTPSHQFPTGAVMPAPRRAALLHWAAERPGERYILEDDYDSEFRFRRPPAAQPAGHGGPRRAGDLSFHRVEKPCAQHPHCLSGAAGAAAGRVARALRRLCQHGQPF
jgi:GntR family transcriptional regulator/MocR family aminotransferase